MFDSIQLGEETGQGITSAPARREGSTDLVLVRQAEGTEQQRNRERGFLQGERQRAQRQRRRHHGTDGSTTAASGAAVHLNGRGRRRARCQAAGGGGSRRGAGAGGWRRAACGVCRASGRQRRRRRRGAGHGRGRRRRAGNRRRRGRGRGCAGAAPQVGPSQVASREVDRRQVSLDAGCAAVPPGRKPVRWHRGLHPVDLRRARGGGQSGSGQTMEGALTGGTGQCAPPRRRQLGRAPGQRR